VFCFGDPEKSFLHTLLTDASIQTLEVGVKEAALQAENGKGRKSRVVMNRNRRNFLSSKLNGLALSQPI
jgi:hypothetical protein